MGRWWLDGDAFAAHWFTHGDDIFPFPLEYLSRFTHANEFETYHRQVRAQHASAEFEELRWAFAAMAAPEVRVEVAGFTGPESNVTLRLLGCIAGGRAVAALQRSPDHIIVRTTSPVALPNLIARALPAVPKGLRRGGRFQRSAVMPDPLSGSFRVHPTRRSAREKYTDIAAAPRALTVVARGYPGPRWAEPDATAVIQVWDVQGDGRYLRYGRDPMTLLPADLADVTRQISTVVDRARFVRTQRARA